MNDQNDQLPWAQLMAFGIGHLHLAPKEFWSMTLREIEAALNISSHNVSAARSPSRGELEALISTHPDHAKQKS